jgi:hypothetical protein
MEIELFKRAMVDEQPCSIIPTIVPSTRFTCGDTFTGPDVVAALTKAANAVH